MSQVQSIAERVETLFTKVRAMEPGGDLETLIQDELKSIKRALYEAAITERADATAQRAASSPLTCPECKATRITSAGRRKRRIETREGRVRYERELYRCHACGGYFSPVDQELGVRPRRWLTPGLRRAVAWEGARFSYEEGVSSLKETLDVSVSSSEFQRVLLEDGGAIDALARADEEEWNRPVSPEAPAPEPQITPERLVVMADAANVLTVKGEEHKSVNCGRVFALEARGAKEGEEGEDVRPFIAESLYTASAVNFEDFTQRLQALTYRGGLRRAKQVAFIADGARHLWAWALAFLGPSAVLIQDFWHVCERLCNLAEELFPDNAKERREHWKELLRASRVDDVLEELRALRPQAQGDKRELLNKTINYLEAGRDRMDYARYRREGWPIGSGAIEATCKYLVRQRFAITGARWRRCNIPAVLALRVARANGDWAKYWGLLRAA